MADAAKKFVDGLKRRTTALLFIQLVLSFMILMVQRLGRDSNTQLLGDWNLDRDLFTYLVIYGYFFILMVQAVGAVWNDESRLQRCAFAVAGCVFYLTVAALAFKQANDGDYESGALIGAGVMCLVLSALFVLDAFWYFQDRK